MKGKRNGVGCADRAVCATTRCSMRLLLSGLLSMALGFPTGVGAGVIEGSANLTCGLKPVPDVGCRIGRCVNGKWEQVCDSAPTLSCGVQPVPDVGCRIGRCVNGQWEQVCDSTAVLTCGLKPIPDVGCRIERCVNGQWEQVCDL